MDPNSCGVDALLAAPSRFNGTLPLALLDSSASCYSSIMGGCFGNALYNIIMYITMDFLSGCSMFTFVNVSGTTVPFINTEMRLVDFQTWTIFCSTWSCQFVFFLGIFPPTAHQKPKTL